VGGGDGLYGLFKGWREFLEIGLADRMPRFVACQAAGANAVVRSVAARQSSVTPIEDAWSIATSAREATAGDHVLSAIYGSGGFAIDVTDAEIWDAMKLLARHGIAIEAAAALSVAGAKKALTQNLISETANVAALLTSTVIKWPQHLAELGTRPATISSSFDELREALVVE
jgi:threonine synthase